MSKTKFKHILQNQVQIDYKYEFDYLDPLVGKPALAKTDEFSEIFRKGGGYFQSEQFHCKFGAVWSGLRKKSQYIFRKRGGGQFFLENSSGLGSSGFPKALLLILQTGSSLKKYG